MGQGYNIPFAPRSSGVCSPSSAPTVRAVGTNVSNFLALTLLLPAGTVDNDLLIAFCENANDGTLTITDWTEVDCTPSTTGGAGLQIFTNVWTTGENLVTNDSGNHQMCTIVGITTLTFDTADLIDVCVASQQASATTAKSITGGTTTCGFDLVFAALAVDLPDSGSSTEFSGETNASLANLTEQEDNTHTNGNGGGVLVISGDLETAGATGTTTDTAVTSSVNGSATISVNAVP